MKEGVEKKIPVTGSGIHMLRKGPNQRFQGSHYTRICPDQPVSKFHISIIKAPILAGAPLPIRFAISTIITIAKFNLVLNIQYMFIFYFISNTG